MSQLAVGAVFALVLLNNFAFAKEIDSALLPCGAARYHDSEYTCYPGEFLCPILDGTPTLRCGNDCYIPDSYSCVDDQLAAPPTRPSDDNTSISAAHSDSPTCPNGPTTQHLSDPPYENYFYSDCHVDAQIIVTSPQPDSNLTIIGPRLIAAWPAGNSGVCAFFAPENGVNGSLSIELINSTGRTLEPVYNATNDSEHARVGISGIIRFNDSALLTVPILGSIRTIRDFTEGPSLLQPVIQDAIILKPNDDGGVVMSREWLDNVTSTDFGFTPVNSSGAETPVIGNKTLTFQAGDYILYADYNYPQLTQLNASTVLSTPSQGLVATNPDQTTSLSFLSYTEKLLAGAWRFLTYFGRDSMIAALLLQPVLSDTAIEAVIGAVLERINQTDGSVCHEETIGDYATYMWQQMNITRTEPYYSYIMIDSDYYLPIIMQRYFLNTQKEPSAARDFLKRVTQNDYGCTPAGIVNPNNTGRTYGQLAERNAEKLMGIAGTFATEGNQTTENLAHLRADQIVGEWRDSTYGIGGGRIPYDVNTALMPAALRSIASLAAAGLYPNHSSWSTLASRYAQIWEDETLHFFEVSIPSSEAKAHLGTYVSQSSFPGSNQTDAIPDDEDVIFHALALDGYNNLSQVAVMNTDDCFRHFLLNTTNQTQLTRFVNQTATNIRRTFPAGLMTSVGMLVANPAYGGNPEYAANWTTSAYHGTVVWSWPLAMMARGLEVQLARCNDTEAAPDFCTNSPVYRNVRAAYNTLWDVIEANSDRLSSEVWSWVFEDGDFQFTPLGDLPPPPGTSPTESDIRQLWSLTFLAVQRNKSLA